MLKLNPLGGYAKIKNHLKVAHRIVDKHLGKYNVLCKSITDRMIYDHLVADIRLVISHVIKDNFYVSNLHIFAFP